MRMAVELPREAASKMLASTTNRERVTGKAGEYRDRLVEFVIRQGIELEFKESIAPAMGVSYGGSQPHSYTEIGRLERQNFSNTFSR